MASHLNTSLSRLYYVFILLSLTIISPSENRVYTKKLSSRTVTTKYGQMRGAIVEFPDPELKPVESYLGLQYATTLTSQMRFMPPMSSGEKWKSIRVAFEHRSVCPQSLIHEEELKKMKPLGEIERLKRIAHFILTQTEECLNLNVYVPTGKSVLLSVLLL